MKDVAELAGVSATTVSFVINQTPNTNIPLETQERVWEAVRSLNYRPNVMARGLRSQTTQTIGFISDEVASTPYAGRIIQGAQDLAWQHNYLLLLINTGNNRELKEAAVTTLLDRQVDGIVYATMYHRPVHPPANIHEVPAVLLDCFSEARDLPSVVPDEVKGGRDAVRHLLQKGHQRIGFLADAKPIPAQLGRMEGYRQAHAEFGLPVDDSLIWYFNDSIQVSGYEGAMHLLQLPDRPTALFCFNDRAAMGAYDAIRKLGLRIPEDVAVVGYDNHEMIAAHLYPTLTTMQLPHYEMGRWAIAHLLQLMGQRSSDQKGDPVQHMIECPLIERAST